MCLSDKNAAKVPSSSEKVNLQRSGLGKKSIQFYLTDSESMVHEKLLAEFEKLSGAGGFELLRCQSNCRHLEKIECRWDVNSLKTNVGSQAKIYIRPIQKDLPIVPVEDSEIQIKETCSFCNKEFPINHLRKHIEMCIDEVMPIATQPATDEATVIVSESCEAVPPVDDELPDLSLYDVAEVISENDSAIALQENGSSEVDDVVKECVSYCKAQNISDPVSILKIFQKMIVTGRDLDINEESRTTSLSGETNFILVDRHNIVKTAFEEISSIADMRKCLEVQFYGETAEDYGGPRKEFFAIVLQQIQKEYFDPVREWSDDYETVGKIMALSTVQNGKLPRFMSSELVEELFENLSPRKFIKDLKKGLNSLGLYKLAIEMPTLVHLFTPVQQTPLTLKMMTTILKPMFTEEGSNRRRKETDVYSAFVKYLRETASGRREGVTLGSVLKFATGTDEEPVLGFVLQPTICFGENTSYIPTANTCVNQLNLTIPAESLEMPPQHELFKLYDYAFCNTYFGLK